MRKKICFSIITVFLILLIIVFVDYFHAAESSGVAYVDLDNVLQKPFLTESDYHLIFQQTGLAKRAVEDIRQESADFTGVIKQFQTQQLEPLRFRQSFIFFPTTTAEQLENEEKMDRSLTLPPLRKGDILITKSTKTLLYRHGHAALVLNPETGETIEALMLGSPSAVLKVDAWRYYPTLLVLRPKQELEETAEKATVHASESLVSVPYRLLTGFYGKDKSEMTQIDGTHCAHLIWQAYKMAGIDVDADGGFLVTPRDIARSNELDIIFSYGFGKDGAW